MSLMLPALSAIPSPTIIFITNSLSYSAKMNPYYKWSLKKETASDSKKKTRKPPSKSLCVKCFEIKKHYKSKASWPMERIKYLVAMNRKSSPIYNKIFHCDKRLTSISQKSYSFTYSIGLCFIFPLLP